MQLSPLFVSPPCPQCNHTPLEFLISAFLCIGLAWTWCVCLPTSLCRSLWFSVLLVFMAASSLSSHFLPQITAAAEQQPVSRAAVSAFTATAGPSWRLHAGVPSSTPATAALDIWGFRRQTRPRSGSLFLCFIHMKQSETLFIQYVQKKSVFVGIDLFIYFTSDWPIDILAGRYIGRYLLFLHLHLVI